MQTMKNLWDDITYYSEKQKTERQLNKARKFIRKNWKNLLIIIMALIIIF